MLAGRGWGESHWLTSTGVPWQRDVIVLEPCPDGPAQSDWEQLSQLAIFHPLKPGQNSAASISAVMTIIVLMQVSIIQCILFHKIMCVEWHIRGVSCVSRDNRESQSPIDSYKLFKRHKRTQQQCHAIKTDDQHHVRPYFSVPDHPLIFFNNIMQKENCACSLR